MKKLLITLLISVLAFCLCFALSACGGNDEKSENAHDLIHFEEVPPECDKYGSAEHWECRECLKYFSDAEGNEAVPPSSVILDPRHDVVNGVCSDCGVEMFVFTLNEDNSSYSLEDINYVSHISTLDIPESYKGLPVTDISCYYIFSFAEKVNIPSGVTNIQNIYTANLDLIEINVDENNTVYKSIDGNLYTKDGKTLLLYAPGKNETHFAIPDGVETVGGSGIHLYAGTPGGCSNLLSVTIPESVKSFKINPFQSCEGIVEIIDHSSAEVTGFSKKEKAGNENGENVNIIFPEGIIVEDSFPATDAPVVGSLKNVIIHNEKESKIVNKDNFLFITVNNISYLVKYVGNDSEITLPESYNGENYKIKDYAFYGCSSLTSVTIPDGVESLGLYAFQDCTNLSVLKLGKTITDIGSYAFLDCVNLTEITVDENNSEYKSIDGNLYTNDGKTLLAYAIGKTDKSFTVPQNVETIGEQAFVDCATLTQITIPEGVVAISEAAFAYCTNLSKLKFPDSVTGIASFAFYGCESLTGVTINARTVGSMAFSMCKSLESVVIESNVECIEGYAFSECENLKTITFADTEKWYVYDPYTEQSQQVNVTSPSENVSMINSDYDYYTWNKE